MNTVQKLKIIKKISQKTQEELAKELGVSFATFNSWINGRSVPHASNQDAVDELYLDYTGEKSIPESELKAKSALIIKKSAKYKDITKHIKDNPDVYNELLLQITYNSNRIEGSTFTLAETASVIFQNRIIQNKDMREHLEAKNHQAAFDHVMNSVHKGFFIGEEFILGLHRILMNGIRADAGLYRNHGVRIVGANVPTANYRKVSELMAALVRDIDMKTKPEDVVSKISLVHSRFEKIHPFSDGNGRIGRLIMLAQLLKENVPPAIIEDSEKQRYYSYLQKSQTENNHTPLEDFIADAVLLGFDIIDRT